MDPISRLLTNLGYELFGVLMPGFSLLLVVSLVCMSAAEVVPMATFQTLPVLSPALFLSVLNGLIRESFLLFVTVLLATSYFCGHLLSWISRSGESREHPTALVCIWDTLRFRPPKPSRSYVSELQPTLEVVAKGLGIDGSDGVKWPAFYPIAKSYILQESSRTITSTYQNKYTLHRAFAVASAIGFWLCIAACIFFVISYFVMGQSTDFYWFGFIVLVPTFVLSAWGFCSSYMYYWRLWGDYIIVETYTLRLVATEKRGFGNGS